MIFPSSSEDRARGTPQLREPITPSGSGANGDSSEGDIASRVRTAVGVRSIVLVGLMGCGKTSIGRRLASRLGMPFVDADEEIERAAAKSINEIFADHGEAHFRDGERRVLSRLLNSGAKVLATGGGAFMNAETRGTIAERGISIWLRAELATLLRRVQKRDTRPLLRHGDPETIMRDLMAARYPVYALADITVDSHEAAHDEIVSHVVSLLDAHLSARHRGADDPAHP